MADGLTTKQELFVDLYLGAAKGNATRAAELAGYEGSRGVLARIGSETLAKPAVRDAVRARLDEIGLSQAEILAELADITRAEWRELIEVKYNHKGEVVEARFNLRDKLMAIELLAKCHGMLKDQLELSGTVEQIKVREIVPINPFETERRLRASIVPPEAAE